LYITQSLLDPFSGAAIHKLTAVFIYVPGPKAFSIYNNDILEGILTGNHASLIDIIYMILIE
jgi:hypothetical protein